MLKIILMSEAKIKLQEIKKKATNPDLSLSEIAKLSAEFQNIFGPLLKDKNKKEERMLGNEVNEAISTAICGSIDKWERGEIEPQKEEVGFLYSYLVIYKQIEVNWAAIEKNANENKEIDADEKQKNLGTVKRIIEELKKRESALKKLFQKYVDKEQANSSQSEEENSDNSNSSEESTKKIQILEQKIIELEEAIETLKKTQNSLTDQSANQEIQQQIKDLQKQKESLQTQLDQLQNNVSSRSSSTTSTNTDTDQRNKKGFPAWLIILIIFGLLVVAGVVGYFILEKKERSPKPKKTKNK